MSSSPRRCSRPRPTAATATAARPASRPPGSRRARRSRSSTSPSRPRSRATPSCTSASSTSSPAERTSSCSARPAPARPTSAIALGIRACLAGHRVAFRTATEWVALLADAQRQGRLDAELDRLQRIPLLIVDEVGYIPFDPHAANLMFMLVCRRYERASMIVTSNKPFSRLGRDLRRRRHRRRDDRPARSPRRNPRPQRRQLPPQRPRPRPPRQRRLNRTLRPYGPAPDRLRRPGIPSQIKKKWPTFDRRYRPTFRPALTRRLRRLASPKENNQKLSTRSRSASHSVPRSPPNCPHLGPLLGSSTHSRRFGARSRDRPPPAKARRSGPFEDGRRAGRASGAPPLVSRGISLNLDLRVKRDPGIRGRRPHRADCSDL